MFRFFQICAAQNFLDEVCFGVRVGLAIDREFPGEAAFQSRVIFGIFGMGAQVVAECDVTEKLGTRG